jgi:hypothetical protein
MKVTQKYGLPIKGIDRHDATGPPVVARSKENYQAFGFESNGARQDPARKLRVPLRICVKKSGYLVRQFALSNDAASPEHSSWTRAQMMRMILK